MITRILIITFATWSRAENLDEEFKAKFRHEFRGNLYAERKRLDVLLQIMNEKMLVNFTEAEADCRRFGAELASIHSQAEVDFIAGVEKANQSWIENTWFGLVINVHPTWLEYRWTDRTSFPFKNFAPGEPYYNSSGKHCGQIMYDRSFDENFGKWKAANCSDDIKAYMCKKPKYGRGRGESGIASNVGVNAGTHETFPHVFKGYQYAIMYDSRKVRFVQARMKCEDLGAQLASIHSREEVEFLKSVVQSNSTLMEDAWIGLVQTVTATVSPLKWIDESPVDYKNFASLEPKYFEDGTYCGQIMTNGDNLSKWKVEKCDAAAYVYVCKKSASGRNGGRKGSGSEDSKLKPNTDANALFPYNFKGNKYAMVYRAGKVVFVQAQIECQNLHGELASIHSKKEVEFLKSVMQANGTLMEDAWIGLVYKVSDIDALKTWVDGSPWDYENFAQGEPRYQDKGNFCGQIITNGDEFSKWKVVNCNEGAHIFVCQARKVDGEGRGSGGGKGSGNESKEEDPDTTEPTTRRPPRGPPTLTPPLPDIPDPNPSEDPDQCSDPSVCSIYRIISEDSDSTVEEKGCYPV